MLTPLLVRALILVVGVGVWEAWRRDVSGAVGSLSTVLLMTGLLMPGSRAAWVLLVLGVGGVVWSVILRRRNRTTSG